MSWEPTTRSISQHKFSLANRCYRLRPTELLGRAERRVAWADQQPGVPRPVLHLQTSNPDSARLHARHGFDADDPAEIPNSNGPTVYPCADVPSRTNT
jgi:hypothetical protein